KAEDLIDLLLGSSNVALSAARMTHAVPRSFDHDPTDLIGVDRFPSAGDRFDLEVANLLVARKTLSLTGLATAMRRRAETGARLAEAIIATGPVAPNDYYRAVAECYGLPFIDLEMQPIDPTLAHDDDRADHAQRAMGPWQSRDGRPGVGATAPR